MNHKIYKKVVLVVLDGFGSSSHTHGNAIELAKKPNFDYLVNNFPSLTLQASGPLVGLPWGEMGNSEVGHLNIGAGRIVGQDLPRITSSIQNGEFLRNVAFLQAIEHVKKNNSNLHLVGMVSHGGVHSLDEHFYALLGLASENKISGVYAHIFTDGRDTEERDAVKTIPLIRNRIKRLGVGEIATIAGRFYGMDRGGHWQQTEMTYKAMVLGEGEKANSAEECIAKNYEKQIFDEMIKPTVIEKNSRPTTVIAENDAVIFFNFRQDRAVQLTQMFTGSPFVPKEFQQKTLQNVCLVTMTEYAKDLPVKIAFPPIDLKNNLAEVLAKNNISQFHIAESEKYAHVTAFFNCGNMEKLPGEERVIVQSPQNSRNYVDHPEMSAFELTDILTQKISGSETGFFIANFANADMVGHTGNLQAGIKAVESLDVCIKKITDSVLACGGVLLITADHGNVEQMLSPKTGEIDKDHTTNPVPFLVVASEFKLLQAEHDGYSLLSRKVPGGVISDVAPTVLELFSVAKPAEMTGVNLFSEL